MCTRTSYLYISLIIGLLAFSGSTAAQSAPTASPWQPVIDSFNAFSQITNGGVLVGRRNDILLNFTKGSFSLSTSYSVASASKMLSSTAIWTLIQDGRLSIDDRPSKFLSWWTTNSTDPRSRVTLGMLLSFTSGFNGDYSCIGLTHEECAQSIYEGGTFTEPGTAFHYTGDHLQIAGVMAYKAGDYASWAALFIDRLKNPTGTTGSVTWGNAQNPRVAGGLQTSPESYASMLMGFYLGTVVNQTTIAQMQIDRTPSPMPFSYRPPGIGDNGLDWHYCASFWYECPYSSFNSSCLNDKFFSSPGAFGFYPAVDRVNDFWLIVAPDTVSPAVTIDWSIANRGLILSILNQVAPLAPTAPRPPVGQTQPSAAPSSSGSQAPSSSGSQAPSSSGSQAPSASPTGVTSPTTTASPSGGAVPKTASASRVTSVATVMLLPILLSLATVVAWL